MSRGPYKVKPKKRFAEILTIECPDCKASVGDLCKSKGVYVHYDRIALYHYQQENPTLIFDEIVETASQPTLFNL